MLRGCVGVCVCNYFGEALGEAMQEGQEGNAGGNAPFLSVPQSPPANQFEEVGEEVVKVDVSSSTRLSPRVRVL